MILRMGLSGNMIDRKRSAAMSNRSYNKSVFINCPSGDTYKPMFHAIVFSVIICEFYPRCAEELEDSSQIRIYKINEIIDECKYGIHDLSMMELDKDTQLPRFNMPFELGLFLGSKYFGKKPNDEKNCLVLEKHSYSYQKCISDISGQDAKCHYGKQKVLVDIIRNWLANNSRRKSLLGGEGLYDKYKTFRKWLSRQCRDDGLSVKKLAYMDYVDLAYKWIEKYRQ